jgi:hypothetical protein
MEQVNKLLKSSNHQYFLNHGRHRASGKRTNDNYQPKVSRLRNMDCNDYLTPLTVLHSEQDAKLPVSGHADADRDSI